MDIASVAVEVYCRPGAGRYRDVERVGRGGRLSPEAFSDLALGVDDIL